MADEQLDQGPERTGRLRGARDELREHYRRPSLSGDDLASVRENAGDNPDGNPSLYKGVRGKARGIKGLFRAGGSGSKSRRRRGALAAVGVGALTIGVGMSFLFSLFAPFKLESMLSGIEAESFAAYNNTFDRRSSRWIEAYVRLRFAEIAGAADHDNLYFRSNKVDTNSPVRDWYRTLRTSSFEADLLRHHGIRFESQVIDRGNGNFEIVTARVTVEGKQIDLSPKDVRSGRADDLVRRLDTNIHTELFADDKSARRAIREAVHEEVHFLRVLRRRHLVRDIGNMTGVRRFRIFEGTRDNVDTAKRRMQQRFTGFVLTPLQDGHILKCLFGAGPCPSNNDPANPDNKSGDLPDGSGVGRQDEFSGTDENGNPKNGYQSDNGAAANGAQAAVDDVLKISPDDTVLTKGIKKVFASKLLVKLLPGFNVVDMLDSLNHIHRALRSGALSKYVSISRAKQAMAVYASLRIMTDQLKAGENVSGDEVSAALSMLSHSELSAARENIYGPGERSVSLKVIRPARAQSEEPVFAEFGDDRKINASSNSQKIEESYNNSVGPAADIFFGVYGGVRNAPVIGSIISGIQNTLGAVGDALTTAGLKITGTQDNVDNIMESFGAKMTEFAGAGPILDGTDGGGMIYNYAYAGATASAEGSLRNGGAAEADDASSYYMNRLIAQSERERRETMGVWDKYFSPQNHESVFTRLVLQNIDGTALESLASLGGKQVRWLNPQRTLARSSSFLEQVFFKDAYAQTKPSPAEFAGVTTYRFSQSVLEMDPLTMRPSDCTNVSYPQSPDWDDVTDAATFWRYVYEERPRQEPAVEKVYNVCLLDHQVTSSQNLIYKGVSD